MNVLIFCPTTEKTNNEQVLSILQETPIKNDPIIVDTIDENSTSFSLENKNYDAVIILYTPAVEFSNNLFEIVQSIEQKKTLGRFVFLPRTDNKELIPPIFHPIRALQLRLFYYSQAGIAPNPLGAQLAAFKGEWQKFTHPVAVERVKNRNNSGRPTQASFGLLLFFSFIILFLVGLITVIIPMVKPNLYKSIPTPKHPPTANSFWLQETFQNIDTTTRWESQHYYTGQQALQTTYSNAGLELSAAPVVTEAVFQLDSLESWPLDELQSLTFSFEMGALEDPGAKSALIFAVVLSEDEDYHLDCLILPEGGEAKIQCQIQSPQQREALSEAVALSTGTQHTATLVFEPLTYNLKLFLDDQFLGERKIQEVPFWRSRSFKLRIMEKLQSLLSGSFSCKLFSTNLAHQP